MSEGRTYTDEQPPGRAAAAVRLAAATRDLVEAVGLADADAEELEVLADEVEALAARVRAGGQREHPLRTRPPAEPVGDEPVRDFVARPANPFSQPLPMTFEGSSVRATWTASPVHEGPPGLQHGGVSAWQLDALLGSVVHAQGTPAVTATLETRYRRPVPVGVPLALEAHVAGRSGSRVTAEGSISADGETCVEARAIFVVIDAERAEAGRGPGEGHGCDPRSRVAGGTLT